MAKSYGVYVCVILTIRRVDLSVSNVTSPVVLHSDHCAKKLLPWSDGMLEANEKYFKENGDPLFSSHMLDLSEEHLTVPLSPLMCGMSTPH